MSKALETFNKGIEDAESILAIYDGHNRNLEGFRELYNGTFPNIDVLKRACVIMTFTAFETFFENLVKEINDKQIHDFSTVPNNKKLERFHNPTAQNIIELYRAWFGIDNCLKSISFDGRPSEDICKQLDDFLKIRGQVVHVQKTDCTTEDVAKKENVTKILNFVKKFAPTFDCYIEAGESIAEARAKLSAEKADPNQKGVSA